MAYNRRYGSRTNFSSMSGIATEKQVAFATSLVAKVNESLPKLPEATAAQVIPLIESIQAELVAVLTPGSDVEKSTASKVIDTMLKASKLAEAVDRPVGLPANADRVIPNRFDPKGGCSICGSSVPAETGFAVLQAGSWHTFCATCANTSPADRQAALDAKRSAEQAEEIAKREAVKALRTALKAVRTRLIDLTGSDTKDHRIRVAVPGSVLDVDNSEAAYALCWSTWVVSRHTGAPGDIRRVSLSPASGVVVADYLLGLSDSEFLGAQAAYGQHFHTCGRCGSPLSDDESKARGLGPDCARKGF